MASKTELESGVRSLLGLNEDELEAELGRRLKLTADELSRNELLSATRATGPTVDREALQSLPDFARKTGKRFLDKFNQQMYSLICDDKDPDHGKVRSAAAQGAEALAMRLVEHWLHPSVGCRGLPPSLPSSLQSAPPKLGTKHFAKPGRKTSEIRQTQSHWYPPSFERIKQTEAWHV